MYICYFSKVLENNLLSFLCNNEVNLFLNYDQTFSALTNSIRIAYLLALRENYWASMSYHAVICVEQ